MPKGGQNMLQSEQFHDDLSLYLQDNVIASSRWKRLPFFLLSHQKPLKIMRNELGRIEQDPNLNFNIILLEDILDGNKNVFLPVSTETFEGLKMKVILQTGFQLPESAKATIDHLCTEILPPL